MNYTIVKPQLDEYYLDKFNHRLPMVLLSMQKCTSSQKKQLFSPVQTHSLPKIFYEAVDLIKKAITLKQKIIICGDFDADGICSTTILFDIITKMGGDVGYYIPDRIKEGYGIKTETVITAQEKGYSVFILVDNGISAFEAIAQIQKLHHQVIILDHHVQSKDINIDCLIHPDQFDEYFKNQCAAGLSYGFAWASGLVNHFHLQLAACATIGDMMPLWGYNRQLVIEGLHSMNQTLIKPFAALLDKTNEIIDEQTVAFQIVPKLNVVGRLADLANVNQVVRFLLSEDFTSIESVAKTIKQLNQKRRQMTLEMVALSRKQLSNRAFEIITHPDFHEGLVGIAAGQLTRELGKPVLVLSEKQESFKGSARSESIDLHAFLSQFEDQLLHFGGHAQAAGLEISKTKLIHFEDAVQSKMALLEMDELSPVKTVYHIDLDLISKAAILEFEKMAPFGMGFEKPLLYFSPIKVIKTAHIESKNIGKWIFEVNGEMMEIIDFQGLNDDNRNASWLKIIGILTINSFNGQQKASILAEKVIKIDIPSDGNLV